MSDSNDTHVTLYAINARCRKCNTRPEQSASAHSVVQNGVLTVTLAIAVYQKCTCGGELTVMVTRQNNTIVCTSVQQSALFTTTSAKRDASDVDGC
jgi:hypothetical protein